MWFVVICLLAFLSHGAPALAQYRFESWTSDSGLPQNIITGLHQTRDGYLWIATLDGLARFDGVRFTVFNKANSPGIQSNRFTSLYADARGDLWLSTEGGSVTRYSRNQFVTYTSAHGLPANVAWGFTGDEAGNLWVLSGDQISRWDASHERFVEIPAPKVVRGYGILTWGRRGGFWAVTHQGLRRFVRGIFELYPMPHEIRESAWYCGEDQDGRIWVASADGRLVHVGAPNAAGEYVWTAVPGDGRAGKPALEMTWSGPSGRAWTIDLNTALHRSITLEGSGRRQTVAVTAILEDREGNLWLGSDGDGLFRVRQQVVTTWSEAQGLVGRNVYPIIEDRTGGIWVGAWSGGLSRFRNGAFTNYTATDGLSAGGITALHEDHEGRVWVATNSGGLQTFSNGRFTPAAPDLVPAGAVVKVIHQDRSGAIWLGSQHGLTRHHNGASTHLTTRDGLAGDDVRVIVESNTAGRLWIGSYAGLTEWRDGRITRWTEDNGLAVTTVRALYEDADGILWIGTYDGGLLRFDGRRFTHVTTRTGLFNDGVFRILEDDRGHFWMSSNRGISRVRKQELNEIAAGTRSEIVSLAIGRGEGMLNAECNGGLWPAGIKARDGTLWFPTQDGVAVIDPTAVSSNPYPPPVVIESVLSDREPQPVDRPLRLPPGRGAFEIAYTSLSFINPEHVRFKYRLSGLDDDWIDARSRRTAYYSHVPPGRYTFTVIAANGDGVWNTSGASLQVDVLPPFYRASWFLALIAAAGAALVVVIWKRREAGLTHSRAVQQAFTRQLIASQEAERKRIAAELHDSLGQRLVIIKNLAMLAGSASTDGTRERVDEIASEAHQAIGEVRDIAQNLRPHELDRVGLTKALTGLVRKAKGASTIELTAEVDAVDDMFAKDEEVNVYRVVQESLNNVLKHSDATRASLAVRRSGPHVQITIEDNGRGFSPSSNGNGNGAGRSEGFGLIGIAERVSFLGGRSDVRSAPGQGTRVIVTFDRVMRDAG